MITILSKSINMNYGICLKPNLSFKLTCPSYKLSKIISVNEGFFGFSSLQCLFNAPGTKSANCKPIL